MWWVGTTTQRNKCCRQHVLANAWLMSTCFFVLLQVDYLFSFWPTSTPKKAANYYVLFLPGTDLTSKNILFWFTRPRRRQHIGLSCFRDTRKRKHIKRFESKTMYNDVSPDQKKTEYFAVFFFGSGKNTAKYSVFFLVWRNIIIRCFTFKPLPLPAPMV